jgi:hypothetical protein
MEIKVTGSSVTAALPEDMVDELVARLDRFGAPDAGKRLRSQQAIHREDVPVVREVLAMWQRKVGARDVSDDLQDLRSRLARVPSRDWEAPH